MDYQKILKAAQKELKGKFPEIIEEINVRIISGSTGGEIIAAVGKYTKDLESVNNDAFVLLKDDITEYLETCKKNGFIIF